jgi:cytolysin (calcineurin-like family phosphatase)
MDHSGPAHVPRDDRSVLHIGSAQKSIVLRRFQQMTADSRRWIGAERIMGADGRPERPHSHNPTHARIPPTPIPPNGT